MTEKAHSQDLEQEVVNAMLERCMCEGNRREEEARAILQAGIKHMVDGITKAMVAMASEWAMQELKRQGLIVDDGKGGYATAQNRKVDS